MPALEAALARVEAAFHVSRPESFAEVSHCDQCAEAEVFLQDHDHASMLEYLSRYDASGEFALISSTHGFHYWMPVLARAALPDGVGNPEMLLFFVGCTPRWLPTFDPRQCDALDEYLCALHAHFEIVDPDVCGRWRDVYDYSSTLARLRAQSAGKPLPDMPERVNIGGRLLPPSEIH
jgi:hypothetical protein